MRRYTGIAAALAGLALTIAMVSAPVTASAQIRPTGFTGFSAGVLCDQESTALCMNAPGLGTVNGAHYHPGDAQDVSEAVSTNCGGKVTSNCPFTLGLGDNNLFLGDSLVTITNLHAGDPYAYNPDNFIYEVESGNGQVYVQLGDEVNGFAYLINVYATDLLGVYQDPVYICTNGSLALLGETGNPASTDCGWTKHST
jgi:hypothetical protein